MVLAELYIEATQQQLVLDSNLRKLAQLDALLTEIRFEHQLSDELFNDIWLVLNEAVTNAIRHGNGCDAAKQVTVSIELRENRFLVFTVKDEGNGFDSRSVPDPTSPERIAEPNGRGVFLIRQLADTAVYSAKGNELQIGFNLYRN